MAFQCVICGKKSTAGKSVSHSKKRTNRPFKPNLQKINILFNGKKRSKYVCTGCIRSGKIMKA